MGTQQWFYFLFLSSSRGTEFKTHRGYLSSRVRRPVFEHVFLEGKLLLDSHSYLRVFSANQQAAELRPCFDIPPSFPRKTVWKVRFQSRHQPRKAKAGVDYPSHPAQPQLMWTLMVCSSTLTLLQLSDTHQNRCFHSWQREEQAHYIFCKIALIKTVAHTVFRMTLTENKCLNKTNFRGKRLKQIICSYWLINVSVSERLASSERSEPKSDDLFGIFASWS